MLSLLNALARGEWGVVSSGAGVPSTLPLIAQSAESKYFYRECEQAEKEG